MLPISQRAGRLMTSHAAVAAAAVAGVAIVAAVALWVHYGTAVFLETIVAGIAACL